MIVLASNVVGLQILKFLADHRYQIDLVVVHGSDKGGMNREIVRLCDSHGLKMADASQLDRQSFLDDLAASRPVLGILAWWPHILKGRILGVPKTGWLNLHPSLLPYNRGKHPNFWCLADGSPCGVSLHFIDAGVDSGPVLAQSEIDVSWEDTGLSVHVKCRERIVELFRDSIDAVLAGDLVPRAQDLSTGSYHSSEDMAARATIDLDAPMTPRQVLNVIRAKMFAGYPPARFYDGDKAYSVEVVIKEVIGDG